MATIALQGKPVQTIGELPSVGTQALDFELVKGDLSTVKLSDYKGKKVVLNVFPSIDTGTCATSVRTFNEKASSIENTVVLCVSRDLPFAQTRFCGAEGIDKVYCLSDYRTGKFGKDYGLEIIDGVLQQLHSRVIVVIDEEGKVVHTEQVNEIVDEPNYEAALNAL